MGQDFVEDDGGVEDTLGVGAPSTGDECDTGECVRREVAKNCTEYLVRKAVSEVYAGASASASLRGSR